MPNNGPGGPIHWWCSTDIRTAGTDATVPPQNVIPLPDHVEFEGCPTGVSNCPPSTLIDADPACDSEADLHVQVANRGWLPVTGVRVAALWCSPTPDLPPLPADFWTVTFPPAGGCGPVNAGSPWKMVDACQTLPVVNPGYPEVAHFHWDLPPEARTHSCVLVVTDSPDDPLPHGGELRIRELAKFNRHVAVRNLHVLSCLPPTKDRVHPLMLFRSRDLRVSLTRGRSKDHGVYLLLPRPSPDGMKGIRREPRPLTGDILKFVRRWKLDESAVYVPEAGVSLIRNLHRGDPGGTIGIVFPLERSEDRDEGVTRVTIEALESDEVLGGNTFILGSGRRSANR
jgi:hypothetical protein